MRVCPVVAAVLALAIAGCKDAGGLGQTRPPATYGDYADQSAALHALWDPVAATDPATLPFSGKADFEGVIALEVQGGATPVEMSGSLALQARFASDTITGSAGGFVDTDDNPYSGSLALQNGYIDRGADPSTEYTFGADLTGALVGAAGSLTINGLLSGDFLGVGHGAAVGAVSGIADVNGTGGALAGDFIAEQ